MRVPLTANSVENLYPVVSPDGSRVAFTQGGQVATMNTSYGGALELLTVIGARYPDWSPDGSEIVYSDDRGFGEFAIEIVDAGTGVSRVVLEDGFRNLYPTFSPDGAFILYARPGPGSNNLDLWAVASDGSGAPFPIETDLATDSEPDWVTGLVLPAPPGG